MQAHYKRIFSRSIAILLSSFMLLGSFQLSAAEQTVTVADQTLALNGIGLRKKGPFKVYQGALYLSNKTQSAAEAISQDGPKRVELLMLRNVGKKKMVGAIVDGFKANTADMSTIQADVDQFVELMGDAKKRQTIVFEYVPGTGTSISQGGELKGTIAGDAFFTALLKVWLGDKPADARLKAGLLSG